MNEWFHMSVEVQGLYPKLPPPSARCSYCIRPRCGIGNRAGFGFKRPTAVFGAAKATVKAQGLMLLKIRIKQDNGI
jgi:hypothetical protein